VNHGRTHGSTDGRTHGRTTRKHIASAGAYRRRRLKNVEKSKLVWPFSRARVSRVPVFGCKGHGHRTSKTSKNCRISSVHIYLWAAVLAVRCQLQTRPTPLLGLIYCLRLIRSATGQMASYHVVTQCRHILLFITSWLYLRCFTYSSVCRTWLYRKTSFQGGHKPGKPGILKDLSVCGKLREFSGNSVQPQGKNCNKVFLVRHSDICVKQLLTG